MPKHIVTCRYCGEKFDTNDALFVKIKNRYAHEECHDKYVAEEKKRLDDLLSDSETKSEKTRVKCVYCDKIFDKDKEPWKQVGTRYAHEACYNAHWTPDDEWPNRMYTEIISKVFGPGYDFKKMERQRAKFNKEGLSNKEIYMSLYYFYIVQNHSTARSNGGIGIVPYVVDDAIDYFNQVKKSVRKAQGPTYLTTGSKFVVTMDTEAEKERRENYNPRSKFHIDPNSLKDLE